MNKSLLTTAKNLNRVEVYKGNWLRFKIADYLNKGVTIKGYEYCERTTRKGEFDGVDILGIMRYPQTKQGDKLIMISNYRPPIDRFVLQFPAGLIDNPEVCKEEAERELNEETGFTPEKILTIIDTQIIPEVSPILYGDPWKSTENGKLVILEVNGDDEKNHKVTQNLEITENINVHLFDLKASLLQDIIAFSQANNLAIEAKVYALSLGLAIGNKLF
jgi:ADP-ribose pyrophosphatase